MSDDEQAIKELGIENLTPEQQTRVLTELKMQIGEALSSDLSEAQFTEYQSIIDADEEVINGWLASHVPDYKTLPAYQEILAGIEDETIATKAYASIAWVQENSPNLGETVARIKNEIKASINDYKD